MGAVYSAQRVSGAPVYGVLFDDGPPPSYTATMAALSAATGYAGFAATYAAPGGGAGSHTATMAALAAATAYSSFAATYAAPGAALALAATPADLFPPGFGQLRRPIGNILKSNA